MRLAAILLIGASLLPLMVLARWTFELKPGAGPQGGEVIFLGWFLLAGWLTVVSVVSSARLVPSSDRTLTRYVLTGLGGLGIAVVTVIVAFVLLNAASVAGTPALRARQDLWGAVALFVALIASNLWVWIR
jgi:hypothetical protein